MSFADALYVALLLLCTLIMCMGLFYLIENLVLQYKARNHEQPPKVIKDRRARRR